VSAARSTTQLGRLLPHRKRTGSALQSACRRGAAQLRLQALQGRGLVISPPMAPLVWT
jgi:hypothetical protein